MSLKMHPTFKKAVEFHKKGDLVNANKILTDILKIKPNDFDSLYLNGIIAYQMGKTDISVKTISKAISINPNNFEAHRNLAIIYKKIGKLNDSIKSFDNAIKINPNHAEIYNHKGYLLIQLNQHQLAIENWNKALEVKPDYFEVYNNLGNAYTVIRKIDNALDCYNKAIKINPNYAEAYINRSIILNNRNELNLALEDCNKAIKIKSNSAEAYNNRGIILSKLKKINSALEDYNKAFSINPNLDFLHGSLIYCKMNLCEWSNLDNDLKMLENAIITGKTAATPYSTIHFFDSASMQQKSAENFVKKKYNININENYFSKKNKEKIRLGYYSADFCHHPTSLLISELLEQHNKNEFELYGFYFGNIKKDEMLDRTSKTFDKFYDVSFKNDKEIAKISRDHKIDIAVDLMGFTEKNRFGIFVEKCAPIQVNYLGYPGTIGSNHINYIIADKKLISDDSKKYFSEKIIYLPDTYQANDSKKKISNKVFTREEFNLPKSSFVYCCFNKTQKITPHVFDIWMKILNKVENSVLWLLEENNESNENLKKEAFKRNVDPNRIIFARKTLLSEHLARHKLANLFLDTFIVGAHTTCSDSLWSGLPVITKTGSSFASNVSASLLSAVGLNELITSNESEYETLAVNLAKNTEKLNKIQNKLLENKLIKPLFNTKLFTKNIEAAYKEIYKKYVNNLPDENIELMTTEL